MKVQINNYIKRNEYGDFEHGHVFFESLVKNHEGPTIPSYLKVNLSKSGNPDCDTSIKFLQSHNGHAGQFTSHVLMREYVRRVMQDIRDVIDKYNMEQEETEQNPNKLDHIIVEDNEDLSPPPAPAYVIPEGVMMISPEHLAEMHDIMLDLWGEEEEEE